MRQFKIKIIFLLVAILLVITGWGMVLGRSDFFFTQLVLGGILIVLLISLFQVIDSTNRSLGKFLFALQHNDFNARFPQTGSGSFARLHHQMNDFIEVREKQSFQIQQQQQLWGQLVEQVPFGLIVLDGQQQIVFKNDALLQYIGESNLQFFLKEIEAFDKHISQTLDWQGNEKLQVLKSEFKSEQSYELIAVQAVTQLGDEVETKAWVQLLQVITHEFMNSVTAISSLSHSLKEELQEQQANSEWIEIAERIEKRSLGLSDFVQRYREVSHIPAPKKSWFNLSELVAEQILLLGKEPYDILLQTPTDTILQIFADREQMGQAILNLLLNAKHAVENIPKPYISVEVQQESNSTQLLIQDNGVGIPNENLNQVFVPFFTTRKEGRGIGLALCRQLMRVNGGGVFLQESKPGKTVFGLKWNSI